MTLSESEQTELLSLCLDIGEELYYAGAEINRIEDTICRIGKSYGAKYTDVFAITSSIVITMSFPGFEKITQMRRIIRQDSTNLTKIEELNALSRRCSHNPPDLTELKKQVREIQNTIVSGVKVVAGSVISTFAFTIFFGGNLRDGIVGAIGGFMITLMNKYLQPLCSNRFFYRFIASLLSGVFLEAAVCLFPVLHIDEIMIGMIMILIPGVAITNSIRNTLFGDTISGIEKFVESLLLAVGVAAGFAVAILLFGG